MSVLGVGGILTDVYQYANRTQKTATGGAGFTERLQSTSAIKDKDTSRVDTYRKYLEQKYGNVSIQSIGKDQQSLDRVGKSMRGNDVVIAPNILEQMANESEKAAYYERKIDDFFNATPRLKESFAAQGLDYQPCGVVIHEDGSVTYIGGCSDSPERVAEVNAINKVKQEKEAARRKSNLECSQKVAEERRQQMELAYRQSSMMDFLADRMADTKRITYTYMPEVTGSAIADYAQSIMKAASVFM
nr:DUF6033 family protein [uncultured Schaedlerella sp.]